MKKNIYTKLELVAKIKLLGKLPAEQKKEIVCSLIGHSKIVDTCFGYIYCGRCNAQVGDSLAGFFDGSKSVIIGHKCDQCVKNYKAMTWEDKYLVKNPF